jgi:hypothetical protein
MFLMFPPSRACLEPHFHLLFKLDPLFFFYVVEARRAIPWKLQNFELTRLKLITLVRRCGGLLLDRRLCGRRRGFSRAFVLGCRCTGHKGSDQHKKEKKVDQDIFLFHSSYSFL